MSLVPSWDGEEDTHKYFIEFSKPLTEFFDILVPNIGESVFSPLPIWIYGYSVICHDFTCMKIYIVAPANDSNITNVMRNVISNVTRKVKAITFNIYCKDAKDVLADELVFQKNTGFISNCHHASFLKCALSFVPLSQNNEFFATPPRCRPSSLW